MENKTLTFNLKNVFSYQSGSDSDYSLKCLKGNEARRLNQTAKIAVDLGLCATENTNPDYVVHATRHGELNTSYELIQSIKKQEIPSPLKFSASTQNAIAGAYSIIKKTTAPMTSISSGGESFSMGFLASVSLLYSKNLSNVLFIYTEPKIEVPYLAKISGPSEQIVVAAVIEKGPEYKLAIEKTGQVNYCEAKEFLGWQKSVGNAKICFSQFSINR